MSDLTSTDFVGTAGNGFNDVGHYETGGPVREISLHWGKTSYGGHVIITGFKVRYGKNEWTPQRGNDIVIGDLSKASFVLEEDEYITTVSGRAGDKIDGLRFHTNKGRDSDYYGGDGGKEFSWHFERRQLAYFRGGFGDLLDRFQTFWAPEAVTIETLRVGTGGSGFNDVGHYGDGGPPREILLHWGQTHYDNKVLITGFKVRYGEKSWSPQRGNDVVIGELFKDSFVLEEGEYIIKVSGRAGDKIDGLQFSTNKGRTSKYFGGQGGIAFTWKYEERQLAYFRGGSGDYLESLRTWWAFSD